MPPPDSTAQAPPALKSKPGRRARVRGLDPVLAVGPVAHQLQPLAVAGQRYVGGLRLEQHAGLVLGPHRVQRLGQRDLGVGPRRHSWIASSESR